jgi:hypothetical protein
LLSWLARDEKGFIITLQTSESQQWSYPVYRFASAWGRDSEEPDVWRVTTTLWMADPRVPPEFFGLQTYPSPAGMTLEYALVGDPRSPVAGIWTGPGGGSRSGSPIRIWYPDPQRRNTHGVFASPNLSRDAINAILNAGAPEG